MESKKFTWTIKNFSELKSRKVYSDTFTAGGYKWRVLLYPTGNNTDSLSLYLDAADSTSLPYRWSRTATFKIAVVNGVKAELSVTKESKHLFNARECDWGFTCFMPLEELKDRGKGFLVNDTLVIEAEVEVPEPLIRVSNIEPVLSPTVEESGGRASPVVLQSSTEFIDICVDVNGFRVLASKQEAVKRIFEKHPDFASNFRFTNHELRSAYMNVVLGVIEKLCWSPIELSEDDLCYARATLTDLETAGFQVEWLKTKLKEISKRKELAVGTRSDDLLKQFENMKLMMADIEAKINEEKAESAAAHASLSFNDIV